MAERKSPAKGSASGSARTKARATASGGGTKRRSVLWRFRRSLFAVGLLVVAGIAGAGFVLAQVPLPPEEAPLQSTFICAADVTSGCGPDNAMAKLAGVEDRVTVPIEEIPQVFIDAVLAAEDRQFFSHQGIDPIGIARALYRDLRNEGVRQGGSTITQQYAKNKFLSSERTVTRKLKEAVLAIKLERELSKEEILERYVNAVYFGRGAYGAEAAARAYFGVSIRQIDLAQAAYLAALIRSPESADATKDPEVATRRRNSVLAGMLEQGWISQTDHDVARQVDVATQVQTRGVRDDLTMLRGQSSGSAYYAEYVRRILYDKYGAEVVNGGGLRVYTAVDLDLQQKAYDAVWGTLDQDSDPSGALVSIDDLGRVVAMVGGRDFDASQVNLALGAAAGGSGRQAGSSFKPIVLATAIEDGYSVESKFQHVNKKVFPRANAGEDWTVSNYAEGAEGVMNLVDATKVSSNTVYAALMLEVGPVNAVEMAHDLGITADVPAVNSLVLGSGDVSVLDMASAYSTFARRGTAIEPILITRVEQIVDGEVRVLEEASTKAERVIETETADTVNWILRQVVLGGTGTGANFGIPIAGKTGTTQDYRDAWFVGYTPRLTTAVWMGFPDLDADGKTRFMTDVRGRKVTGGSFPASIWRAFMQAALDGETDGSFAPPPKFGGEILNSDLSTTTTTLPVCAPDGESEPGATTEPCRPTTTTSSTAPTTSSSSSSSSSTTTTSTTSTTTPDTTTTTEFTGE